MRALLRRAVALVARSRARRLRLSPARRGDLPFSTRSTSTRPARTPFAAELKRALEGAGSAKLVDDADRTRRSILDIADVVDDKDVLSLSPRRPRARVRAAEARAVPPARQRRATTGCRPARSSCAASYTFNDTEVLAREIRGAAAAAARCRPTPCSRSCAGCRRRRSRSDSGDRDAGPPDDLAAHLRARLAPLYVDPRRRAAARARSRRRDPRRGARAPAATSAKCWSSSRGFKWDAFVAANANLGLFGSRKLVDLRIPSGKPGVEGAQGARSLRGRPESRQRDAGHAAAARSRDAERRRGSRRSPTQASTSPCSRVERDELPRWIAARLARQQQRRRRETLAVPRRAVRGQPARRAAGDREARRCCCPKASSRTRPSSAAVADVARFDVFQLSEAWLAGDAARALRILAALRSRRRAADARRLAAGRGRARARRRARGDARRARRWRGASATRASGASARRRWSARRGACRRRRCAPLLRAAGARSTRWPRASAAAMPGTTSRALALAALRQAAAPRAHRALSADGCTAAHAAPLAASASWIVATVMVGTISTLLSATIVNVAFPALIARDAHRPRHRAMGRHRLSRRDDDDDARRPRGRSSASASARTFIAALALFLGALAARRARVERGVADLRARAAGRRGRHAAAARRWSRCSACFRPTSAGARWASSASASCWRPRSARRSAARWSTRFGWRWIFVLSLPFCVARHRAGAPHRSPDHARRERPPLRLAGLRAAGAGAGRRCSTSR